MKKYDYGHLKEIEVRRDDQQLYTFKKGDFKRLRLQDIEDMLILLVQQKLTNLTIDEQYDLNVVLRDTCFNIDVIDEILEEDFDTLLDNGSKILHSIDIIILEEEIYSEFDKFIAMTTNEKYDSESDTKEPPFEKITINTYYKIKTSL
uniref:Reverse transcriptase domain-containing protein n=1 Tax=Tanacetum cinerariifolium TaxID=118510 RepID=A0A6L2MIH0_TANCI|nr:hypothetical protein [Tanacetum cinerariifolium]GEU72025.1 hypothetical protein [Tanacetum cinerariifolium]